MIYSKQRVTTLEQTSVMGKKTVSVLAQICFNCHIGQTQDLNFPYPTYCVSGGSLLPPFQQHMLVLERNPKVKQFPLNFLWQCAVQQLQNSAHDFGIAHIKQFPPQPRYFQPFPSTYKPFIAISSLFFVCHFKHFLFSALVQPFKIIFIHVQLFHLFLGLSEK